VDQSLEWKSDQKIDFKDIENEINGFKKYLINRRKAKEQIK